MLSSAVVTANQPQISKLPPLLPPHYPRSYTKNITMNFIIKEEFFLRYVLNSPLKLVMAIVSCMHLTLSSHKRKKKEKLAFTFKINKGEK